MKKITEKMRTEKALEMIEEISGSEQSADPQRDWRGIYEAFCRIYRIVHSIRSPKCRKNHRGWCREIDDSIKSDHRKNERGFVPLIVIGYIAVAWIIGIGIADYSEPPAWPKYSNTASWCRPHPYDKIALKPWPFRRSRYTNNWREGDIDICTGEVYHDGAWEKM